LSLYTVAANCTLGRSLLSIIVFYLVMILLRMLSSNFLICLWLAYCHKLLACSDWTPVHVAGDAAWLRWS